MQPKRIVLVTYGSRGDVQPMLVLSLALKARGHDVLLCGPPEKEAWARKMGCPFQPFGSNVTAVLDRMKNAYSICSAIGFIRFLRSDFPDQIHVLKKALTKADLAVGASLSFSLSSIAESMEIPYRYVAFTPQLLPSGQHPFLACRRQDWPSSVNRLTWRLARHLDRFNLTALLNTERRKLGLKTVGDAWRKILGSCVVVASDAVIGRVPPDVALAFAQTGYLHLDQPPVSLPELEEFLSKGPPPVYAGFGSMPKEDQKRLMPLIVTAVRSLGLRAVIARFWEAPSLSSEREGIFFISKYPHAHLFPRMAAVIHHGGAGTTACAALSGVSQIIVPHLLDQFYWGHQIHAIGLGPKPIWRSRLTVEKLITALRQSTADPALGRNARFVASKINPGESVDRTVDALLGVFH